MDVDGYDYHRMESGLFEKFFIQKLEFDWEAPVTDESDGLIKKEWKISETPIVTRYVIKEIEEKD